MIRFITLRSLWSLPTQVFQVVAKSSKAKGWQRAHFVFKPVHKWHIRSPKGTVPWLSENTGIQISLKIKGIHWVYLDLIKGYRVTIGEYNAPLKEHRTLGMSHSWPFQWNCCLISQYSSPQCDSMIDLTIPVPLPGFLVEVGILRVIDWLIDFGFISFGFFEFTEPMQNSHIRRAYVCWTYLDCYLLWRMTNVSLSIHNLEVSIWILQKFIVSIATHFRT